MAVETRGKVKSPTRKTDVWGTQQVRSRVLRPGHPPTQVCSRVLRPGHPSCLLEPAPPNFVLGFIVRATCPWGVRFRLVK